MRKSCVFVTGHLKDGSIDLDWDALARPGQTLVVYMGLLGLPHLCRELVAHGLPEATPAAIVQHGTTREPAHVVGTLATLPQLRSAARLAPADADHRRRRRAAARASSRGSSGSGGRVIGRSTVAVARVN